MVKIGQIYEMKERDDPFSEPIYVKVVEIKDDKHGNPWVKYHFVYSFNNFADTNFILNSSAELNFFENIYKIHTFNKTDNVQDSKNEKNIYEIWKNDKLFASFDHGDLSRFGVPFDADIAKREFDSCVQYWRSKGCKAEWAFHIRVCEPNKRKTMKTAIGQLEV